NVYFSDPTINAHNGAAATQAVFPASIQASLQYRYKPPGTLMFSLGVQRQLAQSLVAVVQYVGTRGWDQSTNIPINTLPLNDIAHRQGVAGQIYDPSDTVNGTKKLPALKPNEFRIFPGFGPINQESVNSNFNYNSLQMGIRMENRHGLTMQAAYTWSHEIDIVSNDLSGVANPFDLSYNKGSGQFDRRHIFNVNYVYSLPFFAHSTNKAAHGVLGGW